ncbi:radical SAM protein [Ktedonobacteria bacterium brp13]|nr:radical SAM protein [Ktedonobacteria bacterium brp13]
MQQGATLLWALRSPCNLGCLYCYFGTIEDTGRRETTPGALSHIGRDDISLHDALFFISTMTPECVRRVFVAGGEPLVWRGTMSVLAALKAQGCEVIVCTNGLPLQKQELCRSLLDLSIDAVSISLDSYDAQYNDHWRRDKSGQGWKGVVQGIETLIQQRNERSASTKIGVYSVITRRNLAQMVATGRFVADLGVDYFIVQPIALASDHPLFGELSLEACHREAFQAQIHALHQAHLGIHLAHPSYIQQVLTTLSPGPLPVIKSCFGGRDLFFIEPNGSVWDCPSMDKIQQTPSTHYRTMKGASAEALFSRERRGRNTDCTLFSQDCVNMWQLMQFDAILTQERRTHEQLL